MILSEKYKGYNYYLLSFKVREEVKNEIVIFFLNYNFSWFKHQDLWKFEIIDTSKSNLEKLKKFIRIKYDVKIFNILNLKCKNWVLENQKSDKIIKTGLFSISQGLKNYNKNKKFLLKIPASNSFGTGQHESTLLSIKAIEFLLKKKSFSSVLDLGCGSGILAFVVKKILRNKTYVSDFDHSSRIDFLRNQKYNNLNDIFFIKCRDFNSQYFNGKKFDLIVANILLKTLKKLPKKMNEHNNLNGYLIISGILKKQINDLNRYYRSFKYKLNYKFIQNEWAALIFKKYEIRK